MKISLILYCLSLSLSSWSQTITSKVASDPKPKVAKLCVVISGNAKDDNNFLDEELFKKGQPVAGVKCEVFGSWNEAMAFADKHLIKDGKLLVVQGAHGTNNQTYLVNNGDPISAQSVYKNLKDLSQKYQVGSVIHSCYSAAIMNEKLLDDENVNDRLDKLCLISSSSFGRITYSNKDDIIQNLLKMKPGDNLETPFITTRGGIISSAGWTDVGLPSFLMSKKTEEGFATIEKMNEIMKGNAKCTNIGQANIAMCLAPNVTDETYQDVSSFFDPKIPAERRGFFEANMGSSIRELKEKSIKNPSDIISKDGYLCKEGILSFFQSRFGAKLYNLVYYTEVMAARELIQKEPYYKTHCIPYLATLTDEYKKKSLITESFDTGIDEYVSSLERLEQKYKNKPGIKFDGDFDLYKFADVALSEKKQCSLEERRKIILSKEGIIKSLFGMEFFMDEYTSNYDATDFSPDEQLLNKAVSTQTILKGFQNSALLKPSMKDIKDQKRRKACRDFKF